jgi:hypothetical protein
MNGILRLAVHSSIVRSVTPKNLANCFFESNWYSNGMQSEAGVNGILPASLGPTFDFSSSMPPKNWVSRNADAKPEKQSCATQIYVTAEWWSFSWTLEAGTRHCPATARNLYWSSFMRPRTDFNAVPASLIRILLIFCGFQTSFKIYRTGAA